MTATDELRRLLNELRKLASDVNENEIRSHSVITLSQGQYNRQLRLDMNCDWLNAWHAEHERILQAINATLGCGTCKEVYLLTAMDIGDGKDEVLGVYATKSAAMEAAKIDGNQFGYAFHNVCKWEVVE